MKPILTAFIFAFVLFAGCIMEKKDIKRQDTTSTNEVVIKPENYTTIVGASSSLLPFEINGKWGFIDKKGAVVVAAKYSWADRLYCGLAVVETADTVWATGHYYYNITYNYGYINESGNEVIAPHYSEIYSLISRSIEKALMSKRLMQLETEVGKKYSFESILGKSKQIKDAISLAKKVAATEIPVLLTGETGTGKEVFAQAIHVAGSRNNKSFVAVNCSAFSKDLLANEMFGHKAGSFTGATKDKKGLFEEANNGTIFLDEIGEMEFELQAKLLRIIETGEFLKIGDTKSTKVNVRIIAATNRNLQKEIEEGRFREDLFYRLSVFQIHLPPLRERSEDIEILARSFIETFTAKLAKRILDISPDYMKTLKNHSWRGNIRELRNVIERSLIVCNDESLTLEDLPIEILNDQLEKIIGKKSSDFEMAGMERRHIARVLQYTKGNKTETARLLKIGLTTLYRKIDEFGL